MGVIFSRPQCVNRYQTLTSQNYLTFTLIEELLVFYCDHFWENWPCCNWSSVNQEMSEFHVQGAWDLVMSARWGCVGLLSGGGGDGMQLIMHCIYPIFCFGYTSAVGVTKSISSILLYILFFRIVKTLDFHIHVWQVSPQRHLSNIHVIWRKWHI